MSSDGKSPTNTERKSFTPSQEHSSEKKEDIVVCIPKLSECRVVIALAIDRLNILATLPENSLVLDFNFYQSLDWTNAGSVIVLSCYLVDYVIHSSKGMTVTPQIRQESAVLFFDVLLRWLDGRKISVHWGEGICIAVNGLTNKKLAPNVVQELARIHEEGDIPVIVSIAMLGVTQGEHFNFEVENTLKLESIPAGLNKTRKRSIGAKICHYICGC